MSILRLYSIFDSGVSAYLRPFWSDHKENAMRSFRKLVNDTSDPNNMVREHPSQFTLFEIAVFDSQSGSVLPHETYLSLGNAVEFIVSDKPPMQMPMGYNPDLQRASGT